MRFANTSLETPRKPIPFPVPRKKMPRSPWFPIGSRRLLAVTFVLLSLWSGQAMALSASPAFTATRHYDAAGNLQLLDYSDATPDVVIHERDQQGRVRRLTDAAGERTLNFDAWGGLADENYLAGGVLGGFTVNRGRDAIGRFAGLEVLQTGGSSLHRIE
jgi:hypothetical protein